MRQARHRKDRHKLLYVWNVSENQIYRVRKQNDGEDGGKYGLRPGKLERTYVAG